MPGPRTIVAVAAGKLARAALTRARRGGTALPGIVTLAVDPRAITSLTASLRHGVICVTGTNGKTTTARMLSDIVRAAGWRAVQNRSGSNLDRGLAAALAADARWSGAPRADVAVLEIDEASVPPVLKTLTPRVVVVTNLFRDQLDRHFEIHALARKLSAALAALDERATLVLNADDPIVATLAPDRPGTLFFGIDDPGVGGRVPQAISDASRCPRCTAPLAYERVVLAHVGAWSCASCGLARPPRAVSATRVELGATGSVVAVAGDAQPLRLPIPGLYNAYNALAAAAAARALSIPLPSVLTALSTFRPAFGRLEVVSAEGRTLRLVLVKNPAGFNAAIGALLETRRRPRLLAALNDRDADGRDVSWIWDADFESLAPSVDHAVVTGIRGDDLAVRLKYAGVERERVEVVRSAQAALRRAIDLTPREEELIIIATYTAMLSLRQALAALGHVAPFWED